MTPDMLCRPADSHAHRHSPLGRLATWSAVGLVAVALSGCFTTTDDFRTNAEMFITEQVGAEVGAEFTSVNCDEPLDQQVGTRFTCQAIDSDAGIWEFDNEIDAEGSFTINISQRP